MIRTIILVIVVLLVLSYFGFNLRNLAESPTTQDNFSYVTNFVRDVWNDYLKRPAAYLWNIFVDLIWEPVIENLKKIKGGESSEIPNYAPQIPGAATST